MLLCVVYDIILYRPAASIGYQLVVLTAQATPTVHLKMTGLKTGYSKD